jgi:translation initiation factor 5B
VKWRAVVWAISEALLILAVAINYLPPRLYSLVFRFSIFLMMVDFFLCLIWLPIGVSKTYGFRSAKEVFTQTCERTHYLIKVIIRSQNQIDNGTGAPPAWNWILSLSA